MLEERLSTLPTNISLYHLHSMGGKHLFCEGLPLKCTTATETLLMHRTTFLCLSLVPYLYEYQQGERKCGGLSKRSRWRWILLIWLGWPERLCVKGKKTKQSFGSAQLHPVRKVLTPRLALTGIPRLKNILTTTEQQEPLI